MDCVLEAKVFSKTLGIFKVKHFAQMIFIPKHINQKLIDLRKKNFVKEWHTKSQAFNFASRL